MSLILNTGLYVQQINTVEIKSPMYIEVLLNPERWKYYDDEFSTIEWTRIQSFKERGLYSCRLHLFIYNSTFINQLHRVYKLCKSVLVCLSVIDMFWTYSMIDWGKNTIFMPMISLYLICLITFFNDPV